MYFERRQDAGPAVRNRAGAEPLLGGGSTASNPSPPRTHQRLELITASRPRSREPGPGSSS